MARQITAQRTHATLGAVAPYGVAEFFPRNKSNTTTTVVLPSTFICRFVRVRAHDNRQVRSVNTLTVREQSGYICAGFYGIQRYLRLTRTGACVPWRDGQTRPRGRPSWTYEHGSRGTWPACGCSVDKCVSYLYPFRVCRVTSRLYITSATSQRPRWKSSVSKKGAWQDAAQKTHSGGRERDGSAAGDASSGGRVGATGSGAKRKAGGWERRATARSGKREGGRTPPKARTGKLDGC